MLGVGWIGEVDRDVCLEVDLECVGVWVEGGWGCNDGGGCVEGNGVCVIGWVCFGVIDGLGMWMELILGWIWSRLWCVIVRRFFLDDCLLLDEEDIKEDIEGEKICEGFDVDILMVGFCFGCWSFC